LATVGLVGVRRVRPDEWRALRALRIRALEESPDSFGSTAVEARERDEDDWRAWAAAGSCSPDRAVFVAVENNRIVGLCGSFLHDDDPRTAQIVAMWVEPAYRGRRLAERLLGEASRWSAETGAQELVLDVTETNESAQRLYRRAGFAETGVSEPLRSNQKLLTLHMSKRLRRERAGTGARAGQR
jgi:ribosomal protein S18 acetylase RimI-like enzyme